MSKKVTLQDIADYCGLSKSMVAQVIRDPEHCKAKQKTKDVIAEAVKHLDYHPNLAAKTLSTNQTYTIGIIMPNINGFYYELSIQLEQILTQHGYYCLFSYWNAGSQAGNLFQQAFSRLIQHGIDGIITVQYDESLANAAVPIVTYGNERQLMDCVYPDKLDCIKQAIEYLLKHGHHDIGFMGYPREIRSREIGNILKQYGLKANPDWIVYSDVLLKDGYESFKQIVRKDQPTAVIAHSDLMSIGALKCASEAGIRIPEDISIISYDNLPQSAYTIPALTTFDQCYKTGAELLVKAILNRIKNRDIPQQKLSFKIPLVERESVSFYCNSIKTSNNRKGKSR